MKRLADIVLVLALLPLWLPLMSCLALAVWLIEGRPIFFTQERCGLRGECFRILKFRSMAPGEGPDKERLTRFGAFLRASSLDELPQLILVLTGKMSLVGPRPLPAFYLPRYTSEQRRRHDVRPGITGWAQIHNRNATTWEKRLAQDVWYVENHSILLDAKILFATIAVVILSRGISARGCATMPEFKGAEPQERNSHK